MGLISCPECSKQISDKAKACPGCGYPVGDSPGEKDAPEHQKETIVSLLAQGARNVAEETTAEDVKNFFASRASGLFQLIVASLLVIICISFGLWPLAIIAGVFALRGLFVVFSGDESQLNR